MESDDRAKPLSANDVAPGYHLCPECSGEKVCPACSGDGELAPGVPCHICMGNRWCPLCRGDGEVRYLTEGT